MAPSLAAADIFDWRYGFQMVRIDAESLAALVVHLVAVGDWSDVELVENPVCALDAALVPELAVSVERR
jgi:hypothetical protein